MNIAVIGKRGAGKTTCVLWLQGHPEDHFVVDTEPTITEDELYALKGSGFVIFKVFAESWRRQNRTRNHEQGFDDGWQLDGFLPDQTIGNYGSQHELHQQLADALTREEARV